MDKTVQIDDNAAPSKHQGHRRFIVTVRTKGLSTLTVAIDYSNYTHSYIPSMTE